MDKKTYWKVEVDAFDYGAVKAAVTGSREAAHKPRCQCRRMPGLTAKVYWFDSRETAEGFAELARKNAGGGKKE